MIVPALELGLWLENESMASYVSWRAGGKARWFFKPQNQESLVRWFEEVCNIGEAFPKIYPIGLGSNLLVRDGGYPGIILCMHHALTQLEWQATSHAKNGKGLIFAGAGVASPKVARLAIQYGLGEAEWLATVPGTVGGALAMNAGCYGYETWPYVHRVSIFTPEKGYQELSPEAYEIAYRSVKVEGCYVGHACPHYFLGAWFDFPADSTGEAKHRMKAFLSKRMETQPLNYPNAGSVFRNPDNDYAARVIEYCGLKGCAQGGAYVSDKHANFIVNPQGEATATDIETLIMKVKAHVKERSGIELIPEVRIIGEAL
ncbi:MAG: UDP-N-acetylmuramate dehydrogenase [Pseudomonadota bacterium]